MLSIFHFYLLLKCELELKKNQFPHTCMYVRAGTCAHIYTYTYMASGEQKISSKKYMKKMYYISILLLQCGF